MRSHKRTIRELGVVGLVLAVVIGIVVTAVQADGQRTVRPDTNDGGAWLINRSEGVVGHINRASQEVTGVVLVAESGDRIDTEQSGQFVAVVNQSNQTLKLIDARTFQDIRTIGTPADVSLRLDGDNAVLWTESPLSVWAVSIQELGEVDGLDDIDPVIADADGGDGLVTVTRFGQVIATDSTGSVLHRLSPAETLPTITELDDMGSDIVALSAHGDDAVLLSSTGSVFVVEADSAEISEPYSFGNAVVLGQPTLVGEPITAITSDGSVLSLELGGQDVLPRSSGNVGGADPLPPLYHRGCVFVVTRSPAELTRVCNGNPEPPLPLAGAGTELRLRLINDWVWVNDLDAGTLWVINEVAPLDRIDDWGAALADDEGDDDAESDEVDDGRVEQRENPDADDAEIIRADEIDEDGINERPVANDDDVTTRVDLPIVIDVLRNDLDPDGDVLLVSALDGIPEGSLAQVTSTRQSVQFVPPAGATGKFTFTYSISDGRGGEASATVTVDVVDPATRSNQAPIAVTDAATARAGSSAALNALDNDSDPDGDSIVLVNVEAPSGTVKYDPSGQVTFIPDPGSTEGTEQLRYTIADSFGATATGTIRVSIRLRAANNAPDARSDSAVIPVGSPLSMNVLLNDTDPDGNAISVGADPVRISPADTAAELQLSSDGQLFFTAVEPGQYLYRYTITDAEKQDDAFIRIVVTPAVANRPPIAVRDDVTVPRASSATVFVLGNDYDPDGDVVAIDGWMPTEHLSVESFRGVGFIVTVAPEAPELMSFRYTITDGVNEPVGGVVVVAVAEGIGANQPPIATADVLEVRPGTTAVAPVLTNDFDPEGAPLRIVNVSPTPDAELRISATGQEILVSLPEDAVSGFTFAYDIVDDADNLAGTTVDVRIVPEGQTNRPPIARADTARTRELEPVTILVVNNDSDPDGDIIRLESIAAQPNAGTATIVDGAVVYTPDPGFTGTDRFRYVIADPFDGRAVGDVLVGVIPDTAENRPPSASDDRYTVVAGSDTVLLDVTANDYDPDGDNLTIIRNSGGPAIDTSRDAKGLLFTPAGGIERESVVVTATYTIDDGRGATSDATVTIEVIQALQPEAPIPVDDVVGPLRPGDTIEIDVTANDIDPDGRREQLIVSSSDAAITGGATPRSLVFTAGDATSTHRYTVTDADGLTGTAVVTVIVFDNVAPQVQPLRFDTLYETPITISLADAVSDTDEDDLFFVCCNDNRGGATSIVDSVANTLDLTFTPDPGFSGQAGFSYSVDDQHGHVVAGSVSIVVAPKENGAPTALDSTVDVEAGTSSSVSLSALSDDEDLVTGDVLTYSITTDSLSNASLAGDTVAVVTEIDEGNTSGTIAYTVTDSDGETASATVTVQVTESQVAPPIAVADSAVTNQTVPVDISVIDNDVDQLGQGLRLVAVGGASATGSIAWDENSGVVSFSPNFDFFGTAQLTYVIEDARRLDSGRATGSIRIDVTGFPGVPPTPEAIADNGTATVTWQQPEANGGALDLFRIESDTGIERELAPTSGTTFDSLTNGTPIRFRVQAHNAAGWGDWSQFSDPVTPDTQPGRPGAPSLEFRDGAINVSWTAPANQGTPVTNYILEIGGGQSDSTTLFNTTSFEWTGLNNGVEYQFKVTAVNDAGPSDESPWSTSEHPLRQPGAPPAPTVARGDRVLNLNWGPANDNGDTISNYEVQMRSLPGTIAPIPSGRTHQWSNLPNGTAQEYRVRANNRDPDPGGWSAWSTPIAPCGVPIPGAAPTAVRGDTLASVTWSLPQTNGCAITSLQFESIDRTVQQTLAPTATSATPGSLTNGQSYSFRIRAQNVMGWSEWTTPSNAVIPAGPPCRVTTLNTDSAMLNNSTYVWTPACNNGDAINNYELRVNSGAVENAQEINFPATAGERGGLAPNTTYTYELRACNTIGCGTWSNASTFTSVGPPSTPANFAAAGGTNSITWSWNSVVSNGPGLRYESYWLAYDGTVNITSRGLNTSFSWNNPPPYTPITVQIRACNDFGCSAWSANRAAQATPAFSWTVARNGVWLRGTGAGLGRNVTWNVQCSWMNLSGTAWVLGFQSTITSDSNGNVVNNLCSFDIPGRWIVADIWPLGGTVRNQSNIVVW